MKRFEREKIFKEAWTIVKSNLSFFIGFTLFVSLINLAPEIIVRRYDIDLKERQDLSLIIEISLFLIQLIVGYLIVKLSLLFVDGIEIRLKNITTKPTVFFNYTIGTAFYGSSIMLLMILMKQLGEMGLIMLIPIILIILKFQFVNYIIVDRGVNVFNAFRLSNEITRGLLSDLFFFIVSVFIINLIGAFVFFIGLLITIPISIVAIAILYRDLIGKFRLENDG